MKRRTYTISYFVCNECKKSIPLPRMGSMQREKGHVKDIYCPFCNTVNKTKEIKTKEHYKTLSGEIVHA